jgi:predicted transcriptional regulator
MSISEAERQVMEVLWEESPLTAEDIIQRVAKEQDWSPLTVKTLLNRLLKKDAVSAERDGRRYLYQPVLKRTSYVESQSQELVDRLFNGRIGPLVTHFSERQKLTAQDLQDLKRIIKEIDDES